MSSLVTEFYSKYQVLYAMHIFICGNVQRKPMSFWIKIWQKPIQDRDDYFDQSKFWS